MVIPKYVQDLMSRSIIDLDFKYPECDPGYTLKIRKFSEYQKIGTFHAEIERLVAWANRNYSDASIIAIPSVTRYSKQSAIVNIYDPCMQQLEKYLYSGDKWKF